MTNVQHRRGCTVGLTFLAAAVLFGVGAPNARAGGSYPGPYLYVGDYINQDVYRYDETTGAIDGLNGSTTNAAYITGVGGIEGVQLGCESSDSPSMLTGINASGELYVFNPTTLAVLNSFKAASGGVNIVFSNDDQDAYVADYSGNKVYEYSTASLLTDTSTANAINSVTITDPRELQVLSNGNVLVSQGADKGANWTSPTTPVANATTGVYEFNASLGSKTTVVAANTTPSLQELDYETGLAVKPGSSPSDPMHDIFVASTSFYTDKNQFSGGDAVTEPDIINEYDASGKLVMSLSTTYAPKSTTVTSAGLYDGSGNLIRNDDPTTGTKSPLPQGLFGLQIGDDGNLYAGGFIAATLDKIDLTWDPSGDGGDGDYVMSAPSTYITPGEGGLASVKYFSFSDVGMGECPEPSQMATMSIGIFGLLLMAFPRRRKVLSVRQ